MNEKYSTRRKFHFSMIHLKMRLIVDGSIPMNENSNTIFLQIALQFSRYY